MRLAPINSFSPITSFSGKYRFLSNYYIEPDGTHVEGEFQAQKCANPEDMKKFIGLTPAAAKRLGCSVKLRHDWDDVRLETMRLLVWQKFVDHPSLEDQLLATGSAQLVEGNHCNDTFWGMCNGMGSNHLGVILMEVRRKLRMIAAGE